MKRNRRKKVNTRSSSTIVSCLIVLVVVLLLTYWLVDSRCANLGDNIKRCEQQLTLLQDQELREKVRWSELSTTENLDQAMLLHGIEMDYPQPVQLVRMDSQGQPIDGQLALRRLQAGWSGGTAALQ